MKEETRQRKQKRKLVNEAMTIDSPKKLKAVLKKTDEAIGRVGGVKPRNPSQQLHDAVAVLDFVTMTYKTMATLLSRMTIMQKLGVNRQVEKWEKEADRLIEKLTKEE